MFIYHETNQEMNATRFIFIKPLILEMNVRKDYHWRPYKNAFLTIHTPYGFNSMGSDAASMCH